MRAMRLGGDRIGLLSSGGGHNLRTKLRSIQHEMNRFVDLARRRIGVCNYSGKRRRCVERRPNALSRALAIEVGKYGIRTNTLCPGWIATTYIYHDLGELRHNREKQYAELEKLNGSAPCLSPARAEDVAMHALFFASDMSAYMTGSTIMDDGGASLQTHYTVFSEPDCAYEMRRALYDAILKSEYAK